MERGHDLKPCSGAAPCVKRAELEQGETTTQPSARSPVGQLFAELAKEEDDTLFCGNCGHSFGQHSKGPVRALYCRHCPCPQWQPEQVKTPVPRERDERIDAEEFPEGTL